MADQTQEEIKAAKRLFYSNFGDIRREEDNIAAYERNNRESLIKSSEAKIEQLKANQRFLLRSLYEDLSKEDFLTWAKEETDLVSEDIKFLREA